MPGTDAAYGATRCGAAVVTVNAVLLGGTVYAPPPRCGFQTWISGVFSNPVRNLGWFALGFGRSDAACRCRSFFQSICVLGYCIFPLCTGEGLYARGMLCLVPTHRRRPVLTSHTSGIAGYQKEEK
eukprot:2864252-Rhodomonas_salina.4